MQNDTGRISCAFFSFWASGIAVVLTLFGAAACSIDNAAPTPSALSSEGARKIEEPRGKGDSFYLSETDVTCPGAPPGSQSCGTTGNNDINNTVSALDNSQIMSISTTKPAEPNPRPTIDPTVVPPDFKRYVDAWSKKAQCVTIEPIPSPAFDSFCSGRRGREAAFCAAFVKKKGGTAGIAAMCNVDAMYFGTADQITCIYGHCFEASASFGCEAVRRGNPLKRIQICSTNNDHIFTMIEQPNGKFCILDRWTVPWDKKTPTAQGAVICEVEIKYGKVTVGGKSSENDWYSDLTCNTIDQHYVNECKGYRTDVQPPKPLPPSKCPAGTVEWKGKCKRCKPGDVYYRKDDVCVHCPRSHVFNPDRNKCVEVRLTPPRRT